MAAISSRYARAFADVVFGMKLDVGATLQQLQVVLDIVSGSEDLRRLWENPAIPAAQKRRLLDVIAARSAISRPVRNFMAVLIDNRRIAELERIARQFETEVNQRLGVAEADITSARELSAPEKQALEAQIRRLVGKQVRAHYATDGNLLGGAVVRLGSTIYDGSVRGQLQKIKEHLST